MTVLRKVVGETLRGLRLRQRRTLREVSSSARVSLGYLSEVERGQKEPSSELLAAIFRQRVAFAYAMAAVDIRLTFYLAGPIDLSGLTNSLEAMRLQIQRVAPVAA